MVAERPRLVAPDDPTDVGKGWSFNGTTAGVTPANQGTVSTANTGTAYTVNAAVAAVHNLTVTGNVTLTFSGSVSGAASSFTLILRRDATGTRTITFPASVRWLGAVPTWGVAANSIAGVANFVTVDNGTTWLGTFFGAETGVTPPPPDPPPSGNFNMTVAGTGGGNTRYLALSGSNSNAGTIGSPWGTLQFACAQLQPGDTLLIRGGTYVRHDAVTFNTGASAGSRILVKNYPGETVIFDGQNGGGNCIVTGASPGAKYWVFDGLTFTRYYDNSGNGVLSLSGNDNIIVQRCTFIDNGNDSPNPHNDHCLYVADGSTNILIRNCHMQGQKGAGVHAYSSGGGSTNNVQVVNCTFFDCYWGVLGGDQSNNMMIAQNTFYLCQSEAITFGWGPGAVGVSGLKVYNNVVVTAGSAGSNGPVALGIGGNALSAVTENNNCFYGTSLSTVVQRNGSYLTLAAYKTASGQGSNTIGTNPLLDANYRLTASSPCIGAAIATPSPGPYDYDKDEKTRPVGAGRDMGAFEFGT